MIFFGKKFLYFFYYLVINVYCDLEYIIDLLICIGNVEGIVKVILVFGGKLNIKLIVDYIKFILDFVI